MARAILSDEQVESLRRKANLLRDVSEQVGHVEDKIIATILRGIAADVEFLADHWAIGGGRF